MATILIIDDDDVGRSVMTSALLEAGHRVRFAPSGRQGVIAFRSRPVDLVICELLLPERDGLEVIGQLRETAPGLPIIATAEGDVMSMPGRLLAVARANGVTATLRKPFTDDELFAAVFRSLPANAGLIETLLLGAGPLAAELQPWAGPAAAREARPHPGSSTVVAGSDRTPWRSAPALPVK